MKRLVSVFGLAIAVACGPESHSQSATTAAIVALAAGAEHSVAVDARGELWSWGRNAEGQLGDGSTDDRTTPQRITAPGGAAAAVAAGSDHSLAVDTGGGVWQWGRMSHDQLGVVSAGPAGAVLTEPEHVAGLPPIVAVAAGGVLGPTGFGHSLALDEEGRARAWGYGVRGQLGNGLQGSRTDPVAVQDLDEIEGLAASGYTSVARRNDGTIWTWGSNARGQLGDDTVETRSVPAQVHGLSGITAIAAGGRGDDVHVLALSEDGAVFAWGDNGRGQLGDLDVAMRSRPAPVEGLPEIAAIVAGDGFSLALDLAGRVWAWGGNAHGQLGDGSTTDRATPAPVGGVEAVTTFAAGGDHVLALDASGNVWAWGANGRGQLGDGSTEDRHAPRRITF